MDLAGIYHKANILIAQTYGITGVPEKGYVIVTVNNVRYIVYFYKIESGWNIERYCPKFCVNGNRIQL